MAIALKTDAEIARLREARAMIRSREAPRTYAAGRVSDSARKLLENSQQALQVAIETCSVGGRLSALGRTVQQFVERHGLSVVRDFTGHGVGRQFHEAPDVPNHCDGNPLRGPMLRAGIVRPRVLTN